METPSEFLAALYSRELTLLFLDAIGFEPYQSSDGLWYYQGMLMDRGFASIEQVRYWHPAPRQEQIDSALDALSWERAYEIFQSIRGDTTNRSEYIRHVTMIQTILAKGKSVDELRSDCADKRTAAVTSA